MSHTFTVTIKDFRDYEGLIKLQEEIVNFRFSNTKQDYTHNITGKYFVEGLGFSVNHYANATLRIWREEQESLITVPLEYTYHEYTTLDDPREQIEVVYGIGDYITPAMRKRYRDLEGYRAYRDSMVDCAYAFERDYEDEFGKFTSVERCAVAPAHLRFMQQRSKSGMPMRYDGSAHEWRQTSKRANDPVLVIHSDGSATKTHPVDQPCTACRPPIIVTAEMVDRAVAAFCDRNLVNSPAMTDSMRSALEAALNYQP